MMLNSVLIGLRGQAAMQAEIIALRHQLTVLQRSHKPRRILLNRTDRCLWVWLPRLWFGWRSALLIVKPETVIGWASSRIPMVLDFEDSSWAAWATLRSEGNSRSYPDYEPRESSLGRTSDSR